MYGIQWCTDEVCVYTNVTNVLYLVSRVVNSSSSFPLPNTTSVYIFAGGGGNCERHRAVMCKNIYSAANRMGAHPWCRGLPSGWSLSCPLDGDYTVGVRHGTLAVCLQPFPCLQILDRSELSAGTVLTYILSVTWCESINIAVPWTVPRTQTVAWNKRYSTVL